MPLHENHDHDHELRHHFDDELDEIRQGLVTLGSMVIDNARKATRAVLTNQLDLIGEVRAGDRPVNQLYTELEGKTFEILALQQPVAKDLRFLVATTRILYEMERSGDLAVNIVNCLDRRHGFPRLPGLDAVLSRLVDEALEVFAMGTRAIAVLDPDAGPAADRADDAVDELTARYFREIHHVGDEIGLDNAIQMTRVGRFLERIADHGVNIAENITYVATGSFPEDTHDDEQPG